MERKGLTQRSQRVSHRSTIQSLATEDTEALRSGDGTRKREGEALPYKELTFPVPGDE